jgi:hypothetical protein
MISKVKLEIVGKCFFVTVRQTSFSRKQATKSNFAAIAVNDGR